MHALEVIIAKNQAPVCEICGGDHRTKLPEVNTAAPPILARVVHVAIGFDSEPMVIVADQEPAEDKSFGEDAAKLYELIYNTIPWRTYAALSALIEVGDSPERG